MDRANAETRGRPRDRLLAIFIGVCLGCAGGALLWTAAEGSRGVATPFGPDNYSASLAVDLIRDDVLDELVEDEDLPAWAGGYYYGDGLGVNVTLMLAPHTGFAYVWSGCMGLYGQNYGSVRMAAAHLLLDCEWENEPGAWGDFQTDLIHVPWGARS